MNEPTLQKNEISLTQEARERLLGLWAADRQQAEVQYERLRQKLIKFFEWRGDLYPVEHADEAIQRVANKLTKVTETRAGAPSTYFYGMARMLFVAAQRQREETPAPGEARPPLWQRNDNSVVSRALSECLERCLLQLSSEDRAFMAQYYRDARQGSDDSRQRLADELKISIDALRVRAHGIRLRLEGCVNHCLNPEQQSLTPNPDKPEPNKPMF